jgi:hypothetical protein
MAWATGQGIGADGRSPAAGRGFRVCVSGWLRNLLFLQALLGPAAVRTWELIGKLNGKLIGELIGALISPLIGVLLGPCSAPGLRMAMAGHWAACARRRARRGRRSAMTLSFLPRGEKWRGPGACRERAGPLLILCIPREKKVFGKDKFQVLDNKRKILAIIYLTDQ